MAETKPEVKRIADLAAYQDQSVVSQAIVKKEAGTVTVFAFDEGEGLSEHTAPFDAMVLVLDGRAQVTISGDKYRLDAGEMIIMPAGRPHSLTALERFKMMLVMVRS
ncbi:MAG: cupin domain-containing protein [Terriglobia bacterium]